MVQLFESTADEPIGTHSLPLTPGHACGLQIFVSRFPPIAEQSVPPLSGSGLVQFLVLI